MSDLTTKKRITTTQVNKDLLKKSTPSNLTQGISKGNPCYNKFATMVCE